MSGYFVTLQTPLNETTTEFPFPTAKTAAYAALLIYRANAERPTTMKVENFLLTKCCSCIKWSNQFHTVHISIRRV